MITDPDCAVQTDLPDDLVPFSRAMRHVGMSPCTGRRWLLSADPLPHYRVGGRIKISMSELAAWILRRSGRAGTPPTSSVPPGYRTPAQRRRDSERAVRECEALGC